MKYETRHLSFATADGLVVGEATGDEDGPPVLFLHGSGQTRGAWSRTLPLVAAEGYSAIALDLRGHGESPWEDDGRYSLSRYARQVRQVCEKLGRSTVVVGASLGGMIGIVLAAEHSSLISGLVLVDVVPLIHQQSADRIRDFMCSAPEGFVSLEEAGDAVARYLPHRERPGDISGLRRNLIRGSDGRYRWHWDPRFLNMFEDKDIYALPRDAAARIGVPTLLIRGALSQVVSEEGVDDFRTLVPHAEVVEVAGADHMVAGDSNHIFNATILDFLRAMPRVRTHWS